EGPISAMRAVPLSLPTDLPGRAALMTAATLAVGIIVLVVIAVGLLTLTRKPRDRRLSVYALLALALVSGYVGAAFVVERVVDTQASLLGQLVTIGFVAVGAITYAPLRQHLQRLVDAFLYRDHYDF